MRELDQIQHDFTFETKDRENDSITELVAKFMILELIELKEPLRIKFEQKINQCSKLAMIDEKVFGPIYSEVIKASGAESFDTLYKEPHQKQLNRDMYLRLKFQSINELRKKDAEKIKSLEDQIQMLL